MVDKRIYEEQKKAAIQIDAVFKVSPQVDKYALLFELKKQFGISSQFLEKTIEEAGHFYIMFCDDKGIYRKFGEKNENN
ncbi:MAG: hypothetical protein ABIJ18_05835 [archaeon]